MIYTDRYTIEIPEILNSEKTLKEYEQMVEFYMAQSKYKQRKYQFLNDIYGNPQVKSALRTLFHHKCAYCESILVGQHADVEHFRPKRNAMNIDGTVNADHYWWLTYTWENLYLSCQRCNQSKRSRFPVDGRRMGYGKDLNKEKALLIDPCNKADFEEAHFKFTDSGLMVPLTKKGEVTIDIFNLNREELIAQRASKADDINRLFESIHDNVGGPNLLNRSYSELRDSANPTSTYAAVAQFFIKKYYEEIKDRKDKTSIAQRLESVLPDIDKFQSYSSEQEWEQTMQKEFQKEEVSYTMDMESNAEKEAYFASAKRIKRLEISNFKIIKSLKLDFPRPETSEEPWMVLLGENGAGKSSVMQAIALTLVGARRANELGLNASNFVNRNTRATDGFVKIEMEGMEELLELHFSKDSDEFSSNYEDSQIIMLAFGSTRLMANENDEGSEHNLTNLKNLFNPYATLPNVEQWIADPERVKVKDFDRIAFELKKMLRLPEDKLIYRRKSKDGMSELYIKIKTAKKGIRLKELSSGYQSIIVLTLNIIKTILKTWDSFKIAEGIVLIDEIGVHLHPKWKLQIIRTLREIFPAMTFIITTHEPLCLRGVNKGEVVLMKFDEEDEIIALTDLPSPKGLTVEQLITSKFFGLITSFDPEVETQLNSYYLLKSKLELKPEEKNQLEEIENNLGKYQLLDESKDEVLKPNINIGWISSPTQQDELKQTIKNIWDETF